MDDLPADLKAFLLNHPFLQLTDGKKVSRLRMHSAMLAVLLLSVRKRATILSMIARFSELNYVSNNVKWTTFFVVSRSNAPWMAMSFHATCRSWRTSPKEGNTRSWVLLQTSTTASMSHISCQAQNSRKKILFTWGRRKTPVNCCVLFDFCRLFFQQPALLQTDPQTPQPAATSRPKTCQREAFQESPFQMSVLNLLLLIGSC